MLEIGAGIGTAAVGLAAAVKQAELRGVLEEEQAAACQPGGVLPAGVLPAGGVRPPATRVLATDVCAESLALLAANAEARAE